MKQPAKEKGLSRSCSMNLGGLSLLLGRVDHQEVDFDHRSLDRINHRDVDSYKSNPKPSRILMRTLALRGFEWIQKRIWFATQRESKVLKSRVKCLRVVLSDAVRIITKATTRDETPTQATKAFGSLLRYARDTADCRIRSEKPRIKAGFITGHATWPRVIVVKDSQPVIETMSKSFLVDICVCLPSFPSVFPVFVSQVTP